MKKTLSGVLLFLLIVIPVYSQTNEIETIKQNYIGLLLSENEREQQLVNRLIAFPKESAVSDQMVVELMDRYRIAPDDISRLLSNLQSDGSWKDVDYESQNRSGWAPKTHVERILILAKAYRLPSSGYFESKEVEEAIHKSLKYWTDKKPVSPNWWHNQIGVPKTLGGALILFEAKLTPQEKQDALVVMSEAKFRMTGQNKVWLAGNVLVRGLLENDLSLVKSARDTIASEIKIGDNEGIKSDNSFHQHGAQQQFGNYGAAYISSISFWAQMFGGTSIAFDQSQLNILSYLINDGYRRILWKGYMDVNALGRQFFRKSQIHKAFSVGFSSVMLSEVDKVNENRYKELIIDNFETRDQPTSLTGLYHFWMSDMTVQRRPLWMASVKMSSDRVIGAEAGNGDNLKGYYLADGATYTYVDGDEYLDIYPCWDWRKLPGITSYDTNTPLKELSWAGYHNSSNFVGNVNDGQFGLTAMDFYRDGITARKAWIFTDDYVLCLGAGISADSGCVVTTSIEQQVKKGDLLQLQNNAWEKINSAEFFPQNDTRFFSGKKGYIILEPSKGKAQVESRSGKWNDIMNMYPKDMVETKEVVSLWIDHGIDPKSGSYQYLILPAKSEEEVKQFNVEDIRIIRNTKEVQAVWLVKESIGFVASYIPADVKISKDIHLKSSDTGLFLIKQTGKKLKIMISDPTQQLESMKIEINKKKYIVNLPQGDKRGTSVDLEIP
ncbi:chondroitin AC lyase [Dysgonomonas alginatilytica]|uniref:Chondroitin AC lyase n=1 Tax=Dysgonomonas alginatilytica TaxID=1605892 RepID=A0A2V3PH99_9BACT|nr:polysaccharide lyase 8 family protein [Dysgonomonas alginatilytica]PXV57172.1 chondroitin AC lyase [Dysgonomonas alginatilytica]